MMANFDLPATLRAAAVGLGVWFVAGSAVAVVFGWWMKRWGHR